MRSKGRILRRALKGQGPPGRQGGEGEEEDTARVFPDFFCSPRKSAKLSIYKDFCTITHIRFY